MIWTSASGDGSTVYVRAILTRDEAEALAGLRDDPWPELRANLEATLAAFSPVVHSA